MTLSITPTLITSDLTDHQAAKVTRYGTWFCTWLPTRRLDYNSAITAMTIAEEVSLHIGANVDLIVSLAHELDLLGYEAVQKCFTEAARTNPEEA